MASQSQYNQRCVLRVDVKCCSTCQESAKRKLQRVHGVSTMEYDAEEGLMTVSGDVNPMTLVQKFAKWGRNAELVSVQNQPIVQNSPGNGSATSTNQNQSVGGSQSPVPNHPKHGVDKGKKKKNITKCWLLRWIMEKIGKKKVEPVQWPTTVNENRDCHFPTRLEHGRPWPSPIVPPPLMINPQHQAPYGGGPQPYPPYFGMVPPPLPPYSAGMFRVPPPPPSPPYFTSRQPLSPHNINPMVHYNRQ